MSKEIGFKFKQIFGQVLDVLIPESGSKKGIHLKILLEIDFDRPLLRGTKIKCNENSVWVNFKYENLESFYFYCGRVGHMERLCWKRKADANSRKILDGQFGEWLRADIRRVRLKHHKPGANGGTEDRAPITVLQQPVREGEIVEKVGAEGMRAQQGDGHSDFRAGKDKIDGREVGSVEVDRGV